MLAGMQESETIYLDHAAATPMSRAAVEAMQPYWDREFFNPSAPYGPARRVKAALDAARAEIAHLMGARPASIVFTAGATEANNLALAAADGAVACAATEHASVLAVAAARGGRTIDVEPDGAVTPGALAAALTPETALVSIALANGEIGSVQRLRELAAVVDAERRRRREAGEARPLLLHSDCSQAAPHASVNVSSLGTDLATVSAAKLGGPKQMGLLWAKDGVGLRPLVLGGGQEGGLRSGTENVAGIVGFAAAFAECAARRREEARRQEKMRDAMERALHEAFPEAVFAVSPYPRRVAGGGHSGPAFTRPVRNARRLPNLLHVSFPGLKGSRLVVLLEKHGVLVGTGAACAASKMQASPALTAIGLSEAEIAGSLRITFGSATTAAEAERACDTIVACVRAEYARVGSA